MMSGTLLREHAAKEIKFFDATERVFLHPVRPSRISFVADASQVLISSHLLAAPPQGSVLFGETKISSGFLAYWAKNQTTKVFLRDATEASPDITSTCSASLTKRILPSTQVPLYGLLLFGGKVTVVSRLLAVDTSSRHRASLTSFAHLGAHSQNHFSSLLMVGDGQVKMKAWTRIGVLVNQVREPPCPNPSGLRSLV
jgi:ATP-dependent RNA helicase DHX57